MNKIITILLSTFALVLVFFPQFIKSLNLSSAYGVLFCTVSSAALMLLIYLKQNIHLKTSTDILLLVIRYLHYNVLVVTCAYIFIFSPSSDVVFLMLYLILNIHWILFKGECCLTYFEKKLLDSNYEMGANPYKHIWLSILFGENLNNFMLFMTLLMFYNAGIVINRTDITPQYLKTVVILFICIVNLSFNLQRLSKPNVWSIFNPDLVLV